MPWSDHHLPQRLWHMRADEWLGGLMAVSPLRPAATNEQPNILVPYISAVTLNPRIKQNWVPNPKRKHSRGRRGAKLAGYVPVPNEWDAEGAERVAKRIEGKLKDRMKEKYANDKTRKLRGAKKPQREVSKIERRKRLQGAEEYLEDTRHTTYTQERFALRRRLRDKTEIHDKKTRKYMQVLDDIDREMPKPKELVFCNDGRVLQKPSVYAVKRLLHGEWFVKDHTKISLSTLERASKSLTTSDKARLRVVIEALLIRGNIEMDPGPQDKKKISIAAEIQKEKNKKDKGKEKVYRVEDEVIDDPEMVEVLHELGRAGIKGEDINLMRKVDGKFEFIEGCPEGQPTEEGDAILMESEKKSLEKAKEDCKSMLGEDEGCSSGTKKNDNDSGGGNKNDKDEDGKPKDPANDPAHNILDGRRLTEDEAWEMMFRCYASPRSSIRHRVGVYKYSGEKRLVTVRNVTEVKKNFYIGQIRALCLVRWLMWVPWIAPMIEWLRSHDVTLAIVILPYLRLFPFIFCLTYFTSIITTWTFFYYIPLVVMFPYERVLHFVLHSPYLWEEREVFYVPHLLSLAASEFNRRADVFHVMDTVKAKALRAAMFPMPDNLHNHAITGTCEAVITIVHNQDFSLAPQSDFGIEFSEPFRTSASNCEMKDWGREFMPSVTDKMKYHMSTLVNFPKTIASRWSAKEKTDPSIIEDCHSSMVEALDHCQQIETTLSQSNVLFENASAAQILQPVQEASSALVESYWHFVHSLPLACACLIWKNGCKVRIMADNVSNNLSTLRNELMAVQQNMNYIRLLCSQNLNRTLSTNALAELTHESMRLRCSSVRLLKVWKEHFTAVYGIHDSADSSSRDLHVMRRLQDCVRSGTQGINTTIRLTTHLLKRASSRVSCELSNFPSTITFSRSSSEKPEIELQELVKFVEDAAKASESQEDIATSPIACSQSSQDETGSKQEWVIEPPCSEDG